MRAVDELVAAEMAALADVLADAAVEVVAAGAVLIVRRVES